MKPKYFCLLQLRLSPFGPVLIKNPGCWWTKSIRGYQVRSFQGFPILQPDRLCWIIIFNHSAIMISSNFIEIPCRMCFLYCERLQQRRKACTVYSINYSALKNSFNRFWWDIMAQLRPESILRFCPGGLITILFSLYASSWLEINRKNAKHIIIKPPELWSKKFLQFSKNNSQPWICYFSGRIN